MKEYFRYMRVAAWLLMAVFLLFVIWSAFMWTVCRVYVPEGNSLMLRYKGPLVLRFNMKSAEKGQFAKEGEIGILPNLKGPGRYFYCPIWWETTIVPDQIVEPGQVATCTSQLGKSLTEGFLVEGDLGNTEYKGPLRRVFGPGRYRVHPYAYKFEIINTKERQVGNQTKYAGWVQVPAGYVGVVTSQEGDPALGIKQGVQDEVLPPGLYMVNPREREIDVVEIGYRETTITVEKEHDQLGNVVMDESGEETPKPNTGISFPSNDGFDIQIDFTAIWGIMPDQAPKVIQEMGNVDAVEDKVIIPQSESISRNSGSKLGAEDLLIGESRQAFQDEISTLFSKTLEDKGISLLYGLVRHIYIPTNFRIPLQERYIAEELILTREQERDTARTEALLREAEEQVNLESSKIAEETKKMVASVEAEGQKEAEEIEAETEKRVAAIDRFVAELDAKRTVLLGEAESLSEKLQQQAQADKFRLAVEAFGDSEAYTRWQFAEGLPEDIELQLLYAGDGTLWTDLKNITPTVPLNGQKPPAVNGAGRK